MLGSKLPTIPIKHNLNYPVPEFSMVLETKEKEGRKPSSSKEDKKERKIIRMSEDKRIKIVGVICFFSIKGECRIWQHSINVALLIFGSVLQGLW